MSPITVGFNHVATLTTDLDRLAEFYERAFGAEVTFRMDATPEHPRMFILESGWWWFAERLRGRS